MPKGDKFIALTSYLENCGMDELNEISTENVVYHDVDSYQNLLNIMNSIEKQMGKVQMNCERNVK